MNTTTLLNWLQEQHPTLTITLFTQNTIITKYPTAQIGFATLYIHTHNLPKLTIHSQKPFEQTIIELTDPNSLDQLTKRIEQTCYHNTHPHRSSKNS